VVNDEIIDNGHIKNKNKVNDLQLHPVTIIPHVIRPIAHIVVHND